jgi:phosphoribosyl 1,2-cyclic phosphodiesterase
VVSDVGHVTNLLKDRLSGVTSLFVEANYDETMLQNDTKRPWATKQRISSRHGHLSNDQAAELIGEVACEKLRHVVLGHLSSDCNEPAVARGAVEEKLRARGFGRVEVCCAAAREPTGWLEAAWPREREKAEVENCETAEVRVEQASLLL